jgi:putative transposase
MARGLREFQKGIFIHAYNHLNPEIAVSERHLKQIHAILCKGKERFKGVSVVNYFLSGNHFHLQLFFSKQCEATLSKYMQWLGTVLAKRINKILKRNGKVFRDRFKSKLVKTWRYVHELAKYICHNAKKHFDLNPEKYPYSKT